jgi:hypothetical protein
MERVRKIVGGGAGGGGRENLQEKGSLRLAAAGKTKCRRDERPFPDRAVNLAAPPIARERSPKIILAATIILHLPLQGRDYRLTDIHGEVVKELIT